MKKGFFKLLCCYAFVSSQGYAESACFDCDIQTGYRQDEVSWNIGGFKGKPNILSELEWKDLEICEVGGNLRVFAGEYYYGRASGSYGRILKGKNRDSDYFEDNRKSEYSRSTSDASGGDVFDLSIAGGYRFSFCEQQLTISPVLGYALDEQHLKLKRGFQVIDVVNDYYGPIEGLNSSYRASFQGMFAGVDLIYELTSRISILGTFEYHTLNYRGSGNWNLRENLFKDFEHKAHGSGILGTIGTLYRINDKLFAGVTCVWRDFNAKKGNTRTYVLLESNEGEKVPYAVDHPFNAVKWRSFSSLVTLKYLF